MGTYQRQFANSTELMEGGDTASGLVKWSLRSEIEWKSYVSGRSFWIAETVLGSASILFPDRHSIYSSKSSVMSP
jgi:hypothetical protein